MPNEPLRNKEWLRAYHRAERAGLLDEYCDLRVRMTEAQQRLRALPFGSADVPDALQQVSQLKQDELAFHRRVREILDRPKVAP